ncbi:MAG: type II toxin-antitoxin system VapC family toxin [Phycisphaerae bacterium]|nr:type II toxin-antitoxin system VapC family toxin [Phycisphaerae bacterium]
MAKEKVYIETSVVSYYASRPSRDLVIAARQETTRELWPVLVNRFDRYISMLVLMEIGKGDPTAVDERKEAILDIPVLNITHETESLAEAIVREGLIPEQFGEDSLHIALATVNGMDYLVTWNFRHLNNALTKTHIMHFIEKQGYFPPVLCSPDELLGDSV